MFSTEDRGSPGRAQRAGPVKGPDDRAASGAAPGTGTGRAPGGPDGADAARAIRLARAPGWLADALVPAAPDFAGRVVVRPDDGRGATGGRARGAGPRNAPGDAPGGDVGDVPGGWRAGGRTGLEARTFECTAADGRLRFSGQVRTAPGAGAELGELRGAELLVQAGALELGGRTLGPGTYVRLPRGAAEPDPEADPAEAREAGLPLLVGDSLVYLSIGQIEPTDRERRVIDTTGTERWLDGPIAGIEVLPLHGHRTGNVMLVRWAGAAAFRPKLDPTGEELLVLEGTLHDAHGSYPAGTWIRNPVPAWQSWAGVPGTLVCYKSGHFGALG